MKLQIYDREVTRPTERTTTVRPLDTGVQSGKALSALGNQIGNIGLEVEKKTRAAADVMEYSSIMSTAKYRVKEFYDARSKDSSNYDKLAEDTDFFYKNLSTELLKVSSSDVTQKARIQQGLDQIGLSARSTAINDATSQSIDNTRATQLSNRAIMVQEASVGSDDEIRTVFLGYANQMRTLAKAGIYEQEDSEKDILAFYNDGIRGKVGRLMNSDPQAAIDYLSDPKTFSRLLQAEHRESLIAKAQRLQDAIDRKNEVVYKAKDVDEEKLIKQLQDLNFIRTFKDIRDGAPGIIENLQEMGESRLLSVAGFKDLNTLQQNRNSTFIGNKEINQQMIEQAWMGELQLRDVIQAVNNKQINWEQAGTLTTELEKGAVIVRTEGYKSHLLALKTAVGWSSSLIPSAKQSEMLSLATREFRRRLIAGENLTAVTDEMIARYKKSGSEYFPRPRFKSVDEAKRNLPAGRELDNEIKSIAYHEERLKFNAAPVATEKAK